MITKQIKLWEGREDVVLHTFLRHCNPNPLFPSEPEMLPAVVICPGGAYLFCASENEGDDVAMAFSAEGYQAFVLQYTVGSTCGEHDSRHPAQLLDLGKALLTIREHAEEWHVDTERIALIGFSAGANVCGNMATNWHTPLLSEHFGVPSEYFRPMAVVLGYPVADFSYQMEYNASIPPNPMLMMGDESFFGTHKPTKEQCDAVSPCLHVSEHTPPIFLVHAANDHMVPVQQSLKMAAALAEQGIPFEMHIFEKGEHGFGAGNPYSVGPYRSDKRFSSHAWTKLAANWLLHKAAPETAAHEDFQLG